MVHETDFVGGVVVVVVFDGRWRHGGRWECSRFNQKYGEFESIGL